MSASLHSIRDAILLAQVEGSYGVPGAWDPATHFVDEVEQIDIAADPIRTERLAQQGAMGSLPAVNSHREVRVTFRVAVKGSGAAYEDDTPGPAVLPPAHALLIGAGHAHVVDETVSAEKVTYSPLSQGHGSVALRIYSAGSRWDVNGCVGNVRIVGQVHQLTYFEFEFTGLYTKPVTDSLPAGAVSSNVVPPVMRGITMDVNDGGGAYAAIISQFGFDVQQQIGMAEDAAAANGLDCLRIVDRRPQLAINPYVEDGLDNLDPFQSIQDSTPYVVDLDVGADQYNRYKIDAPQATIATSPYTDRDGVMAYDQTWDVNRDEVDDDYTLIFD